MTPTPRFKVSDKVVYTGPSTHPLIARQVYVVKDVRPSTQWVGPSCWMVSLVGVTALGMRFSENCFLPLDEVREINRRNRERGDVPYPFPIKDSDGKPIDFHESIDDPETEGEDWKRTDDSR